MASTCFQLFANHLDAKKINAVPPEHIDFHGVLNDISWSLFERLVARNDADREPMSP
jgi:hypothetical protein